jgi:septal ring factor EnvC (AmiA/AmiB activator)
MTGLKLILRKLNFIIILLLCLSVVFTLSSSEAMAKKKYTKVHSKKIQSKNSKSSNKKTVSHKRIKTKSKQQTRKTKNIKSSKIKNHPGKSEIYESGDIRQHQKELENLNKNINKTKQKLNTLQKKEKSEINILNNHQKQSTVLKKTINVLEKNIDKNRDTIYVIKYTYEKIKNRLEKMQSEYAGLSREYFLLSNQSSSDFVLSGNSTFSEVQNELYMKSLTEKMNILAIEISRLKDSLAQKENILVVQTTFQINDKNKKEKQNKELQKTIAGKKVLINNIRKDKSKLAKQLADMQNSARKLKGIISQLIKKELEKEKKRESLTSKSKSESNEPVNSKSEEKTNHGNKYLGMNLQPESKRNLPVGSLIWPVNSRKIDKQYGPNRSLETNTIFDNPGVDIYAKVGSPVVSVAGGVVSLIHWLPGYGTLIIINHGGGLRSVYANLSGVNVKKDQPVRQGTVIGRTGESVEGTFLHFELWHGGTRLNPLSYLK